MPDYVPKLGELITGEAHRDAVHVAVVPMKAAHVLQPGRHVGMNKEGEADATLLSEDHIGIVDPFLKSPIKKGQRFHVLLYPGTVISLRHVYRHPILDADQIRQETMELLAAPSVQRLKEIAEEWGGTYEALMRCTKRYLKTGELMTFDGMGKGMNATTPDDFWEHYERVTNVQVPKKKQTDFFRCNCGGPTDV